MGVSMLALALMFMQPAAVSAPTYLYLEPGDYNCLVRNAERYRSQGSDPVIIVLKTCPEIPQRMGMFGLSPTFRGGRPAQTVTEPDRVISLTKRELGCLASAAKRSRARIGSRIDGYVRLPTRIECR